jgi:hypothetical protein
MPAFAYAAVANPALPRPLLFTQSGLATRIFKKRKVGFVITATARAFVAPTRAPQADI